MNDEMRLYLIKEFFELINANMNSSTIYHGLEAILKADKIPKFMLDNLVLSNLRWKS